MDDAAPAHAEPTDDRPFLGGRLTLRQFRTGHRAGTDACLLAAALAVRPGECVVDAGAGVGAAGLAVLHRTAGATGILIERDGPTCALARHNIMANQMAARAEAIEANLFDTVALKHAGLLERADVVISNPPFYESGASRASPDRRRRDAHVLQGGDLADWLQAISRTARPNGRLALIHRPDSLPAILSGWPRGWGGFRICAIHARADRPATRIVVAATKGSRTPLALMPGLVLHNEGDAFTAVAEAIHRGAGGPLL